MKNILLNTPVTSQDYGRYISYSTETNRVKYEFRYGKIPVEIVISAIPAIKAKVGSEKGVALYGKSGKPGYNGTRWDQLMGTLNADIKKELDYDYGWFANADSVIVLPNGDEIDCPHFWATLASYFSDHGDLGGWLGDTVEFADYLNHEPGALFPSGPFGTADWGADLDAHNIYYLNNLDIMGAMKSYFLDGGFSESRRVRKFIEQGSNVIDRYERSADSDYLVALRQVYTGANPETMEKALNKIQTYIDQHI